MSESLTCRVIAGLCAIAILGSASRIAEAQSQVPTPGPINPYGGLPAQQPPATPGGTGGFTGVLPNPSGGASANPLLDARLDQMMQAERQDMGVPPTPQLYNGPMHGPTPNQIATCWAPAKPCPARSERWAPPRRAVSST
ncbi:MAG: hypothetical protein HY246_15425 [Proteobacteria bacterium]|nr:hypothetical protein [Pseudomonadota bacterium]